MTEEKETSDDASSLSDKKIKSYTAGKRDGFVYKQKDVKESVKKFEKEIVKKYFGKVIGLKARKLLIKDLEEIFGSALI